MWKKSPDESSSRSMTDICPRRMLRMRKANAQRPTPNIQRRTQTEAPSSKLQAPSCCEQSPVIASRNWLTHGVASSRRKWNSLQSERISDALSDQRSAIRGQRTRGRDLNPRTENSGEHGLPACPAKLPASLLTIYENNTLVRVSVPTS